MSRSNLDAVPGQRNRSGRHRQRGDRRQPPGADRRRCDLLVPTTDLLYAYRKSLWCGIGGLVPFAKSPPQFSGIFVSAGLTLGVERYRYPGDLPKVAATSGGRDYCAELGLPEMPAGIRAAADRRRRRLQPRAVRKLRHPAELRRASRTGCSGRSTGRPATPRRSECPDDAINGRRSSSSRRSGSSWRCSPRSCSSSSVTPEPVRRTSIRRSSPMPRG